uniref:hypothetical protein n=1 Tax=Paenalcaligenes sp. TaxID=1966342 RepID=UPI00262CA13B
FVSNRTNRKFKAFLTRDSKGKISFEFEPRASKAAKKTTAKKAAKKATKTAAKKAAKKVAKKTAKKAAKTIAAKTSEA